MNVADKNNNETYFDKTRMSLGDHLMELRSRVIKCIFGVVIASGICLFFTRNILGYIATPLFVVLEGAGHAPQLITTTLQGPFVIYIKVALFSGIFLSSPWIFYQLWKFVAAGFYPKERHWVHVFMPFSAMLFVVGSLFFMIIVAPLSFNFFIGLGNKLSAQQVSENSGYRKFIKTILSQEDEVNTEEGDNIAPQGEQPPPPTTSRPMAKPFLTLSEYVSLVTVLSVTFGAAFQMPLVVFLLGRLGLIKIQTLLAVRKYVLFGIVILSALITPPDVISQLALSGPMYVLYELGILLLKVWPKRKG